MLQVAFVGGLILDVLIKLDITSVVSSCCFFYLIDRKLYERRWGCLNNDSSNNVTEQRSRSAASCQLVYLIIKYLFSHQVISFFIFHKAFASVCFSAIFIRHLFSGPNESASARFFCSFWHPTKLIASEGIGVEGLVLFWQLFQKWPSIRWCIVLEGDLSLFNSWLATHSKKKKMQQRYWKFAGYIIAWCDGRYRALLRNDFTSKRGRPVGPRLGFLHNLYNINILSWLFSTDRVLLEQFKQNKRTSSDCFGIFFL